MKKIHLLLLLCIVPLFAFSSLHKFYVSITQINYIQDKQSVQITSRIFIDDFENALRARHGKDITLAEKNEGQIINTHIEQYLKENIAIKINNSHTKLQFIGKEYEGDIMICYIEIEGIKNIASFEISNSVLFDLFKDQQNIVKTKINSKHKSAILSIDTNKLMLNFN